MSTLMQRLTRHVDAPKHNGLKISGLATLALVVAATVWMYPEIRRYLKIRKM